jgi:hypothetical protein
MSALKFRKRFVAADFITKVRLARPVAQRIVQQGIGVAAGLAGTDDCADDVSGYLVELLGMDPDKVNDDKLTSDERTELGYRGRDAAFALGVAVGLLLRPEAFRMKGAAR